MKKIVCLVLSAVLAFCFSMSASAATTVSSIDFFKKVCDIDGNTYRYRFNLDEFLEQHPELEERRADFIEGYNELCSAVGDPTKTILCGFRQDGSVNPTVLSIFIYDSDSSFSVRDISGSQAYNSVFGACRYITLSFSSYNTGYSLTSIYSEYYPAPVSSSSNMVGHTSFSPYAWLIQGVKPRFPSWYSGFVGTVDFMIDVAGIEESVTRNLTINYLYTDNTPAAASVTYPFEPGAEFSIPSPDVPGYSPNLSVVTGTMPDEDASIDVFYNQLFYTMIIKYQYVDGSQAAEDFISHYPMGYEYYIPSPSVNGYTPNPTAVSGIMPAQGVTETVMYVGKPYTLTVIYQYENGLQATDTYQGRFITGSRYNIPSPKLEGYSPNKESVTGIMPGNDITLTVIYKVVSGGSTGAGGTGPGEGEEPGGSGDFGGETGNEEFTGKDPFIIPEIPSFSGKDPFVFSRLPSFLGNNPFTLPGIPSLSGNDPFSLPDFFSFSGNDPFVLPDISSSGSNITMPGIPSFSGRDPFQVYSLPSYSYDPFKNPNQ